MNAGNDERFEGIFGEERAESRKKRRTAKGKVEPPMAGMFGTRSSPLKQADRKSPADKPAPPDIDPDD